MASATSLENILNRASASRSDRLKAAHWVLETPSVFPQLLECCFSEAKPLSIKATWTLEFVCLKRLDLLYPHLDRFIEGLPNVTAHQSLRPLAHICELLAERFYAERDTQIRNTFSLQLRKQMTACCFDWLLTPQKVACQVRAMTALYFLGTEMEWIHPELCAILEQEIHTGSAGYQARGKKILAKINQRKF
jgi:hypothetical protein